eukprot:IDg7053t1
MEEVPSHYCKTAAVYRYWNRAWAARVLRSIYGTSFTSSLVPQNELHARAGSKKRVL